MANKDYIDTVVLSEESQAVSTARKNPAGTSHKIPIVNDVRLTRVGGIEVSTLTIDESGDGGGDPYNSTGKHCILKRTGK
jgi:hypothetical protein